MKNLNFFSIVATALPSFKKAFSKNISLPEWKIILILSLAALCSIIIYAGVVSCEDTTFYIQSIGSGEKIHPSSGRNVWDDLKKLIDTWFKGVNNQAFGILPYFNFQMLYDFLDSLTLLEESAFIHILLFIILLCCIFNIISIFCGNEIIRYLNLEVKFPKLSFYFKLRTTLQKYYLLWNIFIMVFVCILAISINLLVLLT